MFCIRLFPWRPFKIFNIYFKYKYIHDIGPQMIWLDCMEQTMNSRTRGKGTVVGVHIYRRPLALISRVMSPTCAQSEPSPVIAVIKSRWFFKHLVSLRFYKKQMFLSPGNKHMKHIVASLSGLQLPGNIIICDENETLTDSPAPCPSFG